MDLFVPMFVVGLVTSIHCVAMCGSLVLTYAIKDDAEGTLVQRSLPHFAYQGAKIVSYVLVGLALGAIGAAFDLGGVRGWVTLGAGVFMVLLGLNMTGKFPALRRLALRPPRFLVKALSSARKKAEAEDAEGHKSLATPISFGLLTGLLPCGPLQAAQIAAAAAASPIAGAITMLGFGLGTAPLMLGFGTVSGMLGKKFKERMAIVAAVLIVGLGLVMFNRGAMLVGFPVTGQTIKEAVLGGPAPVAEGEYQRGADGVVEVPLVIENVRFAPEVLAIPANEPVRLVVDRREKNACSDQLAIPQLGILANLRPFATTVVELPATTSGTYTLTCGMGMMAGRVQVGGGAARAGNPVPVTLLAAVVLGGVGYVVLRRRQAALAPAGAHHHGGSQHHGGAHRPTRAPAPLGLSPSEFMWASMAVGMAVVLGLAAGGLFRY